MNSAKKQWAHLFIVRTSQICTCGNEVCWCDHIEMPWSITPNMCLTSAHSLRLSTTRPCQHIPAICCYLLHTCPPHTCMVPIWTLMSRRPARRVAPTCSGRGIVHLPSCGGEHNASMSAHSWDLLVSATHLLPSCLHGTILDPSVS